jgi:hypothetical protein
MSDLRRQALMLEAAIFLRDFSKALEAVGCDERAIRAKFLASELKKSASPVGKNGKHG